MPIDSSIYFQQQTPDILGSVEKGLSMREMLQKQQVQKQALQRETTMRDLMQKNTTVDPSTGDVQVNRQGLNSALVQNGMTKEALESQHQFDIQNAEHRKILADGMALTGQLVGNVKDQASWDATKPELIKNNLFDAKSLPDQYDPGFVQGIRNRSITYEKQLAQQNADRTDQRERERIANQRADVGIRREQMNAEKADKGFGALNDHLAKGWSGRSGQSGQVQGKLNAAEYAEGLIEQGKSQNGGLDSRQVEELAQSTSKLLGGSAGASARIEALVPHTAWGQVQSLKEWLSNKPTGQDLQAFTDRMAETVAREKAIAQRQQRQFQVEGLSAFEQLKRKDPERYDRTLKAKGIDQTTMIDRDGRYVDPDNTSDAKAAAVQRLLELRAKAGG